MPDWGAELGAEAGVGAGAATGALPGTWDPGNPGNGGGKNPMCAERTLGLDSALVSCWEITYLLLEPHVENLVTYVLEHGALEREVVASRKGEMVNMVLGLIALRWDQQNK